MLDIAHHIKAVNQTRKITNAMYLISSSRMKKIMPQVEYNRIYLDHIQTAMHDILVSSKSFDHPYIRERGDKQAIFIVISSDKGMVGSYNSDILKFAATKIREKEEYGVITLGITGARFLRKQGIFPFMELPGFSQAPTLHSARHLMQDIFRIYDKRETQQVFLIYMTFVNSTRWEPTIKRILPIDTGNIVRDKSHHEMIYHPSPEKVYRLLAPQYTSGILYAAMMQAYASEHCARMNCMQSATRNADELLKELTSNYNIARQSAITQEITEISGSV